MEEPLFIEFERSGGFAGMTIHSTVDSRLLTADEAADLSRLLDDARIMEYKPKSLSYASQPDQFTYKLTIRIGQQEHFIELTERQIPVSARPLLRYLTAKTREK
ncbi:MAG: hypothetical protein JW973_13135 [Bacteroidales bacterium]|nr:hypothetical protein [Bacteroidales bacterium]